MPSIFVRVNTYPLNVKVSSNNFTSALSVSFTILSNQQQIGLSSVGCILWAMAWRIFIAYNYRLTLHLWGLSSI